MPPLAAFSRRPRRVFPDALAQRRTLTLRPLRTSGVVLAILAILERSRNEPTIAGDAGPSRAPSNRTRMIRDKRTWIVVNAVGAAGVLLVLISSIVFPPTHDALFPPWFLRTLEAFVFAGFIYNIIRRLRGPIQPARWARGMTDKQLWTIKGVLTAALIGGAFVVIALRVPRP